MSKAENKVEKRSDVSEHEGERKYGNVEFADTTNSKYPVDTPEHVRAAWNYINHKDNADKYHADDVKKIKSRIDQAAKRYGINIDEK